MVCVEILFVLFLKDSRNEFLVRITELPSPGVLMLPLS